MRHNVTTDKGVQTNKKVVGETEQLALKPQMSNHRKDTKSDQELTKMSSSATKVQRPRLVATYYRTRGFDQLTFHSI